MESSKSITKEFDCRKHPGEQIQRIAANDSSQLLYCIECILAIEDKKTKDSVLPFKDYIQSAVSSFEKLEKSKTLVKGNPPRDLTAVLDSEDEVVSRLSTYIEAEKLKVETSFGDLIQQFNTLCIKAKQDILANLDNQLHNIRFNYRYYRGKLDKYYGKQSETELPKLTTERGIITAINKCESSTDLEYLIKQINDEMNENKFFDNQGDGIEGRKKALAELSTMIKTRSEILPKTRFSDQDQSQKNTDSFFKSMSTFMDEISCFENEVMQLNLFGSEMDSKVVTKASDSEMIKNWLSPTPFSLKFKLLTRGTRDGFDADTFHKTCDNTKNTLVLVKTSFGKICGGFTELEWNAIEDYKQQHNSFLFSVDNKTKFSLKLSQYSICSSKSGLPAFGGGHDLYLYGHANTNQNNYSNFGHSYDPGKFAGPDANKALTGGYNFKVEEYEVFEVLGYPSQQISQHSQQSAQQNRQQKKSLLQKLLG